MLKVVLNTNILVSASISSKGVPAEIIRVWQEGRVNLITSPEILIELQDVLSRNHLKRKYHLTDWEIQQTLKVFWRYSILVKPESKLKIIKDDSADNKFLEAALTSKADLIVSGDKYLLDLESYQGIKIITARQLLDLLKKNK